MSSPHKHAYDAFGSHWEITVWDDISSSHFHAIIREILARSERFEENFSRFRPSSFVSRLAEEKQTGDIEVPEHFVAMLRPYFQLYSATDGKITPLIGHTLSDLGYDASYSLTPQKIVRLSPDLLETVTLLDNTHIAVKYPVLFDFGAIGKGYFTDRIANFLRESRIRRFLVNGSGDIVYEGNSETIRVGLEHPSDPTQVVGSIEMMQGAFCASGTNRRRWRDYHHIVDPDTTQSPEHLLATWVRAETAATADLLATALFLTNPNALRAAFPFEYATLNPDFSLEQSIGFKAITY
ncbi:MAG: FAD:protein FMN transferase [Candidatus Moraniibacteriota bacterium]|nr:MAG: FAD:protein FMN transferase [Candidatus Moranbacteria bacterium]